MWKILTFSAGTAIVIILLALLIKKLKEMQDIKSENVLVQCFGEPTYSNKFTLNQVREWLKTRSELISRGCKALVLKANRETLKTIDKDVNIGSDVDNYIVIAIINQTSRSIEDSVLVKYESLENSLEELLAKGNGTLVIGE